MKNSEKLGDCHNGGKYVSRRLGRVYKPRSVYWEYLFLSPRSNLRHLINKIFKSSAEVSPFELAPEVEVSMSHWFAGEVEYIELDDLPCDFALTPELARQIGSLLSLIQWFGIGDLHKENMAIGILRDKLICFPLDIECIFDHLTHIKQSLILPSEKVPSDKCGMAKILTKIFESSSVCKFELLNSFATGIKVLNKFRLEILKEVQRDCRAFEAPIRIILRDTKHYRDLIQGGDYKGLLPSEIAQIERGDVPYYFRFLNRDGSFFLGTNEQILLAEFSSSEFDLSTPLELNVELKNKHSMKFSGMISLKYLSAQLGIKSSFETFKRIEISCEENSLVVTDEFETIYNRRFASNNCDYFFVG